MARKSITTSHSVVACDVCGRRLLRGENADVFLHAGARRMVCELCTARAVHEGWIREGLDSGMASGAERVGGARSLLGRLRARREGQERPEVEYEVPPPDLAADELPEEAPVEAPPEPVEPVEAPAPPPAAATYDPDQRSVRGVPTNADMKVARALEVFNAGEHPRTVAGIARSLGPPIVTARPSLTEGSVVTIVVAWELSWYRYEIDLADEAAGGRVVAQGAELSELEPADQAPNAAADERGALHPVASLA